MAEDATELIRSGVSAMCGLSNASFNDRHWGAAVTAAGLMLQDHELPGEAARALIDQATRLMVAKSEWFPSAVRSRPGDPAVVADALASTAQRLHLLGHDTIFGALALRAMAVVDDTATEVNVAALVDMVEFAARQGPGGPFPGWEDPAMVVVDDADGMPAMTTIATLATSAVTAFSNVGTIYDGFDRGVVHHVLTHADALITLEQLGHQSAVDAGIQAHRVYRKLLTRRPLKGHHPLPADAPLPDFRSAAYWQRDLRGTGDWLFGHVFKVARAWFTLAPLVPATVREEASPTLATSMVIT